MTVRDPYTGVERPAPRRTPSSLRRWWPALLIAAIALAGGVAEWRSSEHAAPLYQAAGTAKPGNTSTAASSAPSAAAPAATPAATPDDLARAMAALAQENDRLSNDSMLLIAVAVLQALVLAGQLFLYGQQKRAGRNRTS
jgi:hypothetical protein